MILWLGADSLSARWLLPLQFQTVLKECVWGGAKGHRRENAHAAVFNSFFFLLNFAMDATFFSLYLHNWKLAVGDIASVIISERRRGFLWTKQYIKMMHHRWINSCQWTLHSTSMLRFFCLFLCTSFALSLGVKPKHSKDRLL